MTFTLFEQTGTSGNDTFTGRNLTASYGLAGDDTFTAQFGAKLVFLVGGDGNDSYVSETGSSIFISDNVGTDSLVATEINLSTAQFATIEGRHLMMMNPDTLTTVYVLDWVSGNGADNYVLGGTAVTNSFLQQNLTSQAGYQGDLSWDSISIDFGFTATDIRGAITTYGTLSSDSDNDALSQISDSSNAVYRFFNPSTGLHFYAGSADEARFVVNSIDSFVFEGRAFGAATSGGEAVYRFYNEGANSHFYTISESERDFVIENISSFTFEGVGYNAHSDPGEGLNALFRFYNESSGTHFYTASEAERDSVIANSSDLAYEGIAYYVEDIT